MKIYVLTNVFLEGDGYEVQEYVNTALQPSILVQEMHRYAKLQIEKIKARPIGYHEPEKLIEIYEKIDDRIYLPDQELPEEPPYTLGYWRIIEEDIE